MRWFIYIFCVMLIKISDFFRNIFVILTVFIASSHCFDLQCVFEDLNKNPSVKSCKVVSLSATSTDQIVTKINGQNELGFDKEFVKAFEVLHQTVNYIPKNIGEIFPALVSIEISHSKLKSINKFDL